MNDLTRIDSAQEAPARFSIAEFQPLADVAANLGIKLELADGILVRMSPALGKHMRLQQDIFGQLYDLLRNDPLGRIPHFQFSVRLGDAILRDVDVAVVTRRPADDAYGEPEMIVLAIEISDRSLDYDLQEKRVDYAGAGIPNYWVVDVENARTHVMTTPLDRDYAERRLVLFGEPLTVPGTDRTITIG